MPGAVVARGIVVRQVILAQSSLRRIYRRSNCRWSNCRRSNCHPIRSICRWSNNRRSIYRRSNYRRSIYRRSNYRRINSRRSKFHRSNCRRSKFRRSFCCGAIVAFSGAIVAGAIIAGAYVGSPAEQFYDMLQSQVEKVPKKENVIIMGHFNAKIGSDFNTWSPTMGKFGLLLEFCLMHKLAVINTFFQHKSLQKVNLDIPVWAVQESN